MRSKTYSFVPTTNEAEQQVAFDLDGIFYRAAVFTLKNFTDQVVQVKLLSLEDLKEVRENPSHEPSFGWFEIHPDKEYTVVYPKFFDLIRYKAKANIGGGTLDLSILDYEPLRN